MTFNLNLSFLQDLFQFYPNHITKLLYTLTQKVPNKKKMNFQTCPKSSKHLRALLVQNNPQLLKKQQNIQHCRNLLNDPKKWIGLNFEQDLTSIDIIAFPQMAFTGYNFEHHAHVLPMACVVDQGDDFEFAKQVAIKYKAYVIFGYVQKVLVQKTQEKQTYELYNAAAVLDRQGRLILNTRKTHLYFCDQLWSKEGDGFKTLTITNTQQQEIKCAIGICMDINEKNFKSGKYQLADFMIETKSECLLFISNWTDSPPKTNNRNQLYQMMNYWLYRLEPLLQKEQPQRLFLICDRVGAQYNFYEKKETAFFGCSGGLNLNPPKVYDVLDKKQQACIFIKGELPNQELLGAGKDQKR